MALNAGQGHPVFSVCIVSAGRPTLPACLASISDAAGAAGAWVEVLIVANGTGSLPVESGGPVTVCSFPTRMRLGPARNHLAAAATGDVLVFLDDDVEVPVGYFRHLDILMSEFPEASVLGGPNRTITDAPAAERAQGVVLATRLVAGPFAARYGLDRPVWDRPGAVTLCNLVVRREQFAGFPSAVDDAGEETVLLAETVALGRRILAHPDLWVAHHRRATLGSFAAQAAKYGRGRMAASRAMRRPSTTIATLGAIASLVFAGTRWPNLLAVLVGAHLVATAAATRRRARTDGTSVSVALLVAAAYILQVGYLVGLVQGLAGERIVTKEARAVGADLYR